jgi:S-(hydroxymethyl)glutathione dehydrogenase/alcohol dehydrogenase
VVVIGVGGIGSNAVQGARYAGAKYVVAVDPVETKQAKARELGATHAVASGTEAIELVQRLTDGVGADSAILAVDLMRPSVVADGFAAVSKGGTVVLVGLSSVAEQTIELPGSMMVLFKKTLKGTLFGDCNPTYDIPRLLGLYQSGDLKLDELITRTYPLEDVNLGYEDLLAGRNTRGVLVLD